MMETKLSRREFLSYGVASSAALLSHDFSKKQIRSVPLARSPRLAPLSSFDARGERSLVLVHLDGGNDSYNTLVPYTDKFYYRARPNIALRGREVIKLDKSFAFNAALEELAHLYQQGRVAVFPNVGCTESLTKSHERASRIWHTASPDEVDKEIWTERLAQTSVSVSKLVLTGFDTHQNQKDEQFKALRQLSTLLDGMQPFERTIVLVYSEFGRSFNENDELGTDHGSTGLCLAIGDVRGGVYETPIDFRQIYSAIAADWFKSDMQFISEESHPAIDFIA